MAKRAVLAQLTDLDFRLLRVFRVVVECGGVSAAELELNIGRSTISKHLKDLEVRLGVCLCHRGRGGFALTDEGHQIYQSTLKLMGAVDEFRAGVQQVGEQMTGHLALALFDKTATNPDSHLPRTFALFDQKAPRVTLGLHVESMTQIESGVIDGKYQLGVVPVHRQSASLNYLPLFKEQMSLYCGYHHPLYGRDEITISRDEIIAQKYAGLGYHSPNMETAREHGFERSATAYDQEAMVHLLCAGCYLAYLPDHYARQFVEKGLIRRLGGPAFRYGCEFAAIYRKSPKPSRILSCFIDCLQKSHRCASSSVPE